MSCSGLLRLRRTEKMSLESIHSGSRIHERLISLRFLRIFLRFFRLEVSVNNVYNVKSFSKVTVNSKVRSKTLKTFALITSKNSASGDYCALLKNGIGRIIHDWGRTINRCFYICS